MALSGKCPTAPLCVPSTIIGGLLPLGPGVERLSMTFFSFL